MREHWVEGFSDVLISRTTGALIKNTLPSNTGILGLWHLPAYLIPLSRRVVILGQVKGTCTNESPLKHARGTLGDTLQGSSANRVAGYKWYYPVRRAPANHAVLLGQSLSLCCSMHLEKL
jgi:hypothetical protein